MNSTRITIGALCLTALAGINAAHAQNLASGMGLFAYPAQDQSPAQIAQDDAECYSWAAQQTGRDPLAAANQQAQQQPQQARGGNMVRGAAVGATAGVLIGDTGDSAATGAAVGALAGGVANRRQARQQANAQAQTQQQTQAANDQFRRAQSTCLQGRGYQVD